jgi:hypothetical protein
MHRNSCMIQTPIDLSSECSVHIAHCCFQLGLEFPRSKLVGVKGPKFCARMRKVAVAQRLATAWPAEVHAVQPVLPKLPPLIVCCSYKVVCRIDSYSIKEQGSYGETGLQHDWFPF